jgi:hypothetical protein
MLVNAKCAPHYIKTVLESSSASTDRRSARSGPTPEGPAAARRERTTWGYGRTAMSRRAPTSRSSREPFASRVSRTSGTPRSCFAGIRRRTSLGGRCGECELNGHCGGVPRARLRDDRRPDGRRPSLHSHAWHVRGLASAPCPPRALAKAGLLAALRLPPACEGLPRSSTAQNRRRPSRGTMRRLRA